MSGCWVDGVQLVNVGGELCEACEERRAVGRSIGGHLICKRCAGWARREADELEQEREASAIRRGLKAQETREVLSDVHARLNTIPPREVKRRATVSRITRERNYREFGATPTHFNCGHSRRKSNLDHRSDGRTACKACRRIRDKQRRAG